MKLSEIKGAKVVGSASVAFVGNFEMTQEVSRDGEPYYVGKLVSPITVRCSTDREILPVEEVEELYVRESDVDGDLWIQVDDKDPKKGITIKGYKTDFSKGQEFCLFQSETIAAWSKGNRKDRATSNRLSINERIKARDEARKNPK